jgi:3D (Asp-Asp-Asp) domain-containing protein
MANGQQVHHGAAASRLWPLGTRIQHPGGVVTITDRTGPGTWSQLDIWMSSCDAAVAYGRRTIRVQVIR